MAIVKFTDWFWCLFLFTKLVFGVFYLCFCFINTLDVCQRFHSQHKLTSLGILNLECGPCMGRMHWKTTKLGLTVFSFTVGELAQDPRSTYRGCENATVWPSSFLEKQSKMHDSSTSPVKKKKKEKETELPKFSFPVGHLATLTLHLPWLLLKPKEIRWPSFMFILLGMSISKAW